MAEDGQVVTDDFHPLPSEAKAMSLAKSLLVGSDESGKKLDDFRNSLRQLNQRWNDRFRPERESLPKSYLDRRFAIVIHGNLISNKKNWVLYIENNLSCGDQDLTVIFDDKIVCECNCRQYNDIVVFVDLVEGVKPIQVTVPSLVRLYFFKDQPFSASKGSLYRIESGSLIYKTFPFFGKRKQKIRTSYSSVPQNGGDYIVESGFEVMDCISDDERKLVWDWFEKARAQGARLAIHDKFVEFFRGEAADSGLQILNVAIGPLNL